MENNKGKLFTNLKRKLREIIGEESLRRPPKHGKFSRGEDLCTKRGGIAHFQRKPTEQAPGNRYKYKNHQDEAESKQEGKPAHGDESRLDLK